VLGWGAGKPLEELLATLHHVLPECLINFQLVEMVGRLSIDVRLRG
jgi:hypothetical protein